MRMWGYYYTVCFLDNAAVRWTTVRPDLTGGAADSSAWVCACRKKTHCWNRFLGMGKRINVALSSVPEFYYLIMSSQRVSWRQGYFFLNSLNIVCTIELIDLVWFWPWYLSNFSCIILVSTALLKHPQSLYFSEWNTKFSTHTTQQVKINKPTGS
jgi:hypothetical protein